MKRNKTKRISNLFTGSQSIHYDFRFEIGLWVAVVVAVAADQLVDKLDIKQQLIFFWAALNCVNNLK